MMTFRSSYAETPFRFHRDYSPLWCVLDRMRWDWMRHPGLQEPPPEWIPSVLKCARRGAIITSWAVFLSDCHWEPVSAP